MFKVNENANSKMSEYAESIYDYLVANELEFDEYDYDDFAEELDVAIQNGEVASIPELDREDAFRLAVSMDKERDDYYDDESIDDNWDNVNPDLDEGLVKDTNQMIKMLNESLVSKKAKKLGLVHVGFGNYAEEPGGPAQYKTVNGKLKKVKGASPKKHKPTEKPKEKPKEKEEPKKDAKPKKTGITDVRRVSGEKFTYEFMKDGRKYKFTLNKLERKELKGEGSVMDIIKQRMKKKEAKQKSKQFKKGQHVEKPKS